MGLTSITLCWVFCAFCIIAKSESSSASVSVRFLQVPPLLSNQKSATFVFEASGRAASKDTNCSNCSFTCKLDERISLNCEDRNASFSGLQDGHHTFMVCANASQVAGCSTYNWTVDTVPPTAYVTSTNSFTNAGNISVNISFTEPCAFGCLTVNTCNLIVYGSGQVIPQTLTILQPNLTYSLTVALSSSSLYGRAIVIMDKAFCRDAAGNIFTRTENSNLTIRFDRRSALLSLRTRVPEKLVELNGQTRTVQATNDSSKLKVYLYFSQPIMNTSHEILSYLKVSHGILQPIQGKSLLNRRFGYVIEDVPKVAVVTVNFVPDLIISREGNPVSQADPATFLYDSERLGVMLSRTSKMRTKEKSIPISIRFTKPVFSFSSAQVSISGGHIQSFTEVSRNYYVASVQVTGGTASISILENMTSDVAGNKNLPSNVLQLKHYSKPVQSIVLGYFVSASFFLTCLVAALLTVSTAILQSAGALSRSPQSLTSDPTRNLFRIACYIQVFALSRWLVVNLPVEYYELTACLKWSVPYMNLPWENESHHFPMLGPAPFSSKLLSTPPYNTKAVVVYGAPLTATEYTWFFESQNSVPQAEYIPDPENQDGWIDFKRSMVWLAIIMGSCILLHLLLLVTLKLRDCSMEKRRYGALVIPRLELFLLMLSVPCICKASVSVIKGGSRLGIVVGFVLLIVACSVQLALLVFLSFGVTLGKLLQYKEVHQVGQKFHWYQELVRVTLGPGKRGQWTWKDQPNSTKLVRFGPLFEDLRGPPKYMLSQFSSTVAGAARRPADRSIIASDDETEDAEAPFIQKLFGILRIYYTVLDSLKRFSFGVASGIVSTTSTAALTLLCITSFQLFFLLLKKPFIKKKVQLVEIISIACQVGMLSILVSTHPRIGGVFMLSFFVLGYISLLINEWYALYKQIKRLDAENHAFLTGLRRASAGLLLFLFPKKLLKKLDQKLLESKGSSQENVNGVSSVSASATPPTEAYRESRGSSGVDKAWIRQIREMAKSGTLAESSTGNTTRWSRFWSQKRSGSSSMSSSTDYKSKPKSMSQSQSQSQSGGLYKDMEAIFAASSTGQAAPESS